MMLSPAVVALDGTGGEQVECSGFKIQDHRCSSDSLLSVFTFAFFKTSPLFLFIYAEGFIMFVYLAEAYFQWIIH